MEHLRLRDKMYKAIKERIKHLQECRKVKKKIIGVTINIMYSDGTAETKNFEG